MPKILPYPWQHPIYDPEQFNTVVDQVEFCQERVKEANTSGLPSVADAWDREILKCVPDLLEYIEKLESEMLGYN